MISGIYTFNRGKVDWRLKSHFKGVLAADKLEKLLKSEKISYRYRQLIDFYDFKTDKFTPIIRITF
jgi:hypothetical protein